MTALFILINLIIMWWVLNPFLALTYKVAIRNENFLLLLSATVCTMALFTMCFLAPGFVLTCLTIITIIDKACERVR